jgi:integrase
MSSGPMVLVDAAGRRRSPATTPGYLAGRAPHNKGMQYPPDPPRPEEIIVVMRQAGHGRHGLRLRALIAVLWRAGLRISEALALNETDIDTTRGSLLIRHGKGDKRREAGMDQFGFEQLAAWMTHRVSLPVGPLFWVIDGPTRGRRWAATAARCELRQLAAEAGVRGRFAPHQLRHTRGRARPGGRCGEHHPTPTRPHRPRNNVDLPAGHRPLRNHRRCPITTPTHHLSNRRTHPLTSRPLAAGERPSSAASLRPIRLPQQKRRPRSRSGDVAEACRPRMDW